MILVPLAATAQLLHANVWEYMLFGGLWSGWLCLIHSEVHHPWDPLFRALGLGTAADHHVHHRTFIYNYGHTVRLRLASSARHSPSTARWLQGKHVRAALCAEPWRACPPPSQMMWWDRLVGTYKYPEDVRQFNSSLETKVQGSSNYALPDEPTDASAPVDVGKAASKAQ
jgi:sterol desaturase/sphingolipid hydroxylase (fatty acid hydroxylase superfamily)